MTLYLVNTKRIQVTQMTTPIFEDNDATDFRTHRNTFWRRWLHWEHLPLLLIILFTLGLHFTCIMKPETVVGDEYYYVNNARSIISGAGDNIPEHPPLAKLFIITGIYIFGDNPFGWRFFSVVFGTVAIILLYFICRKLKMSHRATVFATFLFALDNMFFVHASLAWLDIYMITFMLTGFLLYLYDAYTLMGMAFALSALCKFAGGLAIPVICFHWLLTRRTKPQQFIISFITTFVFFLLFMTLFEYFIQGIIIDAVQRTMDILQITASITFASSAAYNAVRPWEWLLPHKIFSYSVTTAQYLSFISWTIQIFIIPAVVYMVYKSVRGNNAACFGVIWFAFTYLTWIPVVLITDRITYDFYFLPATGAVCTGIGIALSDIIDKLKADAVHQGRIAAGGKMAYAGIPLYLLLHLVVFIISNPALPNHLKEWLGPIIR